jgi:hypothetical protein
VACALVPVYIFNASILDVVDIDFVRFQGVVLPAGYYDQSPMQMRMKHFQTGFHHHYPTAPTTICALICFQQYDLRPLGQNLV